MDPKDRSTKPSTQDKAQTSNGIPSSNPILGQTVVQGSPYHNSSQNMYASHPFPNTTHFHIGPTIGSFTPIPNQGGKTTTNASYMPQPCVGSPDSLPFTYNQHVVIYQQSGQNISNHTSNADHMNPDHAVPTQPQDRKTKVNEGRRSEGNTVKKRDRTNGPGSEAVDLRNSPNFAGSEQVVQGLADLAQEVNNLKMLLGNYQDQFNVVGADLKGKFNWIESYLVNEFSSMRERNRRLKKRMKRLKRRIALDQENKEYRSSSESSSTSYTAWGDEE